MIYILLDSFGGGFISKSLAKEEVIEIYSPEKINKIASWICGALHTIKVSKKK